ncbi:dethiobiotin synthase [Agaribacter marinus]|uniref:ATP-dependent dethiobiotin synthetase BioD n=1 Tax=Agaribacter marinus TaxID=1431249 RepID=A0AA37SZK7_9ALTE|nr:dethiobiotin synthase [Agaribacter marinus]GLR72142.1 ATP-dependent dethiobiotin synthetase BioD [Agaribacter marinus]
MRSIFITGTDTDVGKTFVSKLMLDALKKDYPRTLGFKPIAAGCEHSTNGLRNEDALTLQAASTIDTDYNVINPIAFEPPIAPHIAAATQQVDLSVSVLSRHYKNACSLAPDILLTEGAGGWRLPLSANKHAEKREFLSDFVAHHKMQVVLVVGMRLGCLNHAVLTYEAIKKDGLTCVGWIANRCVASMLNYEDNKQTLTKLLDAPLLAEVPYASNKNASCVSFNKTEYWSQVF